MGKSKTNMKSRKRKILKHVVPKETEHVKNP